MQQLINLFPLYILLVDENHNIIMANEKVSDITKLPIKDIIQKYCPKVIHGIDHSFEGCPLEEAVQKNRSIEKEVYDYKNNRWLLSCIYKTKFITSDGLKIFLHFIQDITDKKKAIEKSINDQLELKRALYSIIKCLINVIDIKDPYTASHLRRVTRLATIISKKLKLSKEKIKAISLASLIHDIGKISIPASILSKPNILNELEFSMIKMHPQVGYNILIKSHFNNYIATIILQHHERLNGTGYPQGLTSNKILFEAKILAVADVVEAMSSHRPYRPAYSTEKVLEELKKGKNKLYDPLVVQACLDLFNKDKFKF